MAFPAMLPADRSAITATMHARWPSRTEQNVMQGISQNMIIRIMNIHITITEDTAFHYLIIQDIRQAVFEQAYAEMEASALERNAMMVGIMGYPASRHAMAYAIIAMQIAGK